MNNEYDVIVIGSGMGGLTTAALLAKTYNKKVLVLEKHWTLGGLTHEFERKQKYSWDVGVHYIGAMEEKEIHVDLFDYISDCQLKWDKVNDPYDIFWYPDFKFGAVSGKEQYKKDLIKQFPDEKEAIGQYFVDIKKAQKWGRDRFLSISTPRLIGNIMKMLVKRKERFFLQTAQAYFDARFRSEKLKALLLSQWGDHGFAPNEAVFWIHASIAGHYLNGAYYPRGGSKKIAETIIPVIEKAGGKCLASCDVQEIIVKNNQAVGVKYLQRKGRNWIEKEIYADKIVSNVGAKNTFGRLLKDPIHPEVNRLNNEATSITIYMGLKENPGERFGVTGGNFWMFEHYDHNKIANNRDLIKNDIDLCFVSFPSLKDTSKKAHTAEIVAFIKYDLFTKWANTAWKKRGEEYDKIKEKIANKFLKYLDGKFKGFSKIVDFVEVSTPLSIEEFTSKQNGAMYGLPVTKERFQMECLKPRTAIKNLYLSGGDSFMPGVCGALLAGLGTASLVGGKMGLLSIAPRVLLKLKKERKRANL